jgi:hypothetical protein
MVGTTRPSYSAFWVEIYLLRTITHPLGSLLLVTIDARADAKPIGERKRIPLLVIVYCVCMRSLPLVARLLEFIVDVCIP